MLDFKPAKKTGKYKTDWAPDQSIEDLAEEISNYTGDGWDYHDLPSDGLLKILKTKLDIPIVAMDNNGWCLVDYPGLEIVHYSELLLQHFQKEYSELPGWFDIDDFDNVYCTSFDWPEVYYIQYFPDIYKWQSNGMV